MNASELKARHLQADPKSHFFDAKTMRFFGDRMANFGVRRVRFRRHCGDVVDAFELYRRRAVRHGLKASAYFHAETFEQVHGEVI